MPPTYTWKEKLDRRSSKVEQSKIAYQRVYQLVVSERVDEATARIYVQSVGPAPDLQIGQAHPIDANAKLLTIDLEDEAEDGRQWLVTVAWQTLTGGGSLSPDPFGRAPEIEWDQSPETIPIFKDFSTTPKEIKNSAGQKFDNAPTRDRGLLTLQFVRNETPSHYKTVLLPLMAFDYVVNSASFTIDGVSVPALFAKLGIRATKVIENSIEYYRVTYTLQFRKGPVGHESDGWREWIEDRGFYELFLGVSGLWDPILDKRGLDISSPWPLNGAGVKRPNSTDPPAEIGPFKFYPEVSFSSLAFT